MTLSELIERVEKASGPDHDLDYEICKALGYSSPPIRASEYKGNVSGSIDAALALVEKCLPEWSWEVRKSGFGTPSMAEVWDPLTQPGFARRHLATSAANPPLALLSCLLRALHSKEQAE